MRQHMLPGWDGVGVFGPFFFFFLYFSNAIIVRFRRYVVCWVFWGMGMYFVLDIFNQLPFKIFLYIFSW